MHNVFYLSEVILSVMGPSIALSVILLRVIVLNDVVPLKILKGTKGC